MIGNVFQRWFVGANWISLLFWRRPNTAISGVVLLAGALPLVYL
jgi:anti-sigma-K factor RskA